MSDETTIRAWKDAELRDALNEQDRGSLEPNPAGEIELTDAELSRVHGGSAPQGPPPPCSTTITITIHHSPPLPTAIE